jgi:hypothetical protein
LKCLRADPTRKTIRRHDTKKKSEIQELHREYLTLVTNLQANLKDFQRRLR